jgi:flagellum-specific peptidoglycan hydrolase FlgJ
VIRSRSVFRPLRPFLAAASLAAFAAPSPVLAVGPSCTVQPRFGGLQLQLQVPVGSCLANEARGPESSAAEGITAGLQEQSELPWKDPQWEPARPEVKKGGQSENGSETAPAPPAAPRGANPEQAAFILKSVEGARASDRETGVPAAVTIAQAILESSWGKSKLSRENHNYFGIKARKQDPEDKVVWYNVWEVVDGENVIQPEPFRAYASAAESFIDHGHLFLRNKRYAKALAARDDSRQFAHEIARAGYATDPGYAPKLVALMDRFDLYAYDVR